MRSLQLLLTAASVAALSACAAAPLDPEKAYEIAAASADPSTPAVPGAASPAQGGPAGQPAAKAWPVSDLKPDPGVKFGQLPNGMRYALMKNATPAAKPPSAAHRRGSLWSATTSWVWRTSWST
jgi:zinc protease